MTMGKKCPTWWLKRLVPLLLLGLWALGGSGPVANSQGGCHLMVREDIYFLPPSELAGTKSYPEVLILENDSITVWAVPNRGRLVFDLVLKETGHSQLLTNANPLPLRFQGVYTFEFGGVYTTFPWNKRDQQPLNLEFEVLQGQGTCEVQMRSQDPETAVQFIGRLRLPPVGPELQITMALMNLTDAPYTIPFGIVALIKPGGTMTEDTELLLPVERVRIGSSHDGWMGPEGTEVTWPASWARWGAFQGAGWFYADLRAFHTPELAVYNPQADESLLLRWESRAPWNQIAVFSWGPAYAHELGAYPAFRIELQADALDLSARGEQVLDLRLLAQRGRPADSWLSWGSM